jgi:amidophosphoribosyltransferase
MDTDYEEKKEECGIVAILSKKGEDVAPYIYRALVALQHRGQDAAGLAIWDGKGIEEKRGVGLVDRIFDEDGLGARGTLGIGHTRYPTSGECHMCDVQPFISGKLAIAHNGHIANADAVRKNLEALGYRFTSSVDSEVMVRMCEKAGGIRKAAKGLMELEGAFSVAAIENGTIFVFRDRFALRPLVWGEDEDFICFASETVALDINKIPYKGDVPGGSLVSLGKDRVMKTERIAPETPRHCMFEYVYFARPDSVLDKKDVYSVRTMLGKILAQEAPVKADVIIPVPDTSRIAAGSMAKVLGIPCEEGLMKNRYIGRTFIMPNQQKRVDAIGMKLNPIPGIIKGKRVILVDDSIVRGTTLRGIITLVRGAGAKEVHVRITCPPIRAPCFYGVDMSTYKELIANKKSIDEIGKELGADSLAYLSLGGLKKAIGLDICTEIGRASCRERVY